MMLNRKTGIWFILLLTVVSTFFAEAPVYGQPAPKQASASKKLMNSELVPLAMAKQRIQPLHDHIKKYYETLDARFNFNASVQTVSEALRKSNVRPDLMGHADAWGKNGLYLTWTLAMEFYRQHWEALERSLGTFEKQGYARKEDLEYLEKGYQNWLSYHEQMKILFEQWLDAEGKRGEMMSKQRDISDQISQIQAQNANNPNFSQESLKPLKSREDSYGLIGGAYYDALCKVDEKIRRIGVHVRVFESIDEDPVDTRVVD